MLDLASKQKALIISALCFFLILVGGASYFFLLSPLNEKVAQAEKQLEFEEKLLQAVTDQQASKIVELPDYEIEALQRRVPVKPLVDQFIFDLEKAEIYSDSFILNYSFSEEPFSGIGLLTEEEVSPNGSNGPNNTDERTQTSERIIVTMSVVSPGYEEFIDFLDRIENLERITKIDQLSFTGNAEVMMVEQTVDDILFSVTISTFYLPDLEEFAQFLPQVDYPYEYPKYNPLYYGVKKDRSAQNE